MEIKDVSLYNRAKERILRRETLKSIGKLPKGLGKLEELEKEYKEIIKDIATRILNGEFDEEIREEMEIIRKEMEQEQAEQVEGEER